MTNSTSQIKILRIQNSGHLGMFMGLHIGTLHVYIKCVCMCVYIYIYMFIATYLEINISIYM